MAGLRPLPFQSGVLICLAGQPVQLEAYDCPRTLAAVWEALLAAAALDALDLPAVPTPGRRARRFVDWIGAVPLSGYDAGLGRGLNGDTLDARVGALVWQGRAVHTVASNLRHPLLAA